MCHKNTAFQFFISGRKSSERNSIVCVMISWPGGFGGASFVKLLRAFGLFCLTSLFNNNVACSAADVPALAPITMSAASPASSSMQIRTDAIAQTPPPGVLPTDVTPYTLRGSNVFSPGARYRIFQKLPERLFFNLSTEVSQRLDTNVFFTNGNRKADYAFRVQPNITLGYNPFGNTGIYCNYFVIKDVFAVHHQLTQPTTQSVSWGVRQDFPIKDKANIQFDFQARELWQSRGLRQADLLPALNMQYYANPTTVLFASTLLQMRSGEYFQGATRELDPFFSWGFVKRFGLWNFTASDTLVLNYRGPTFRNSVPRQSNKSMIAQFEISHPIHKSMPGLDGFLRLEPAFNWGAHGTPGLSGTNVRLMSGLRYNINKPSYAPSIERVRRQLGALESRTISSTEKVQTKATTTSSTEKSDQAKPNLGPGPSADTLLPTEPQSSRTIL